jgi:hypothetical protein
MHAWQVCTRCFVAYPKRDGLCLRCYDPRRAPHSKPRDYEQTPHDGVVRIPGGTACVG